jgi:hypothetical protein
VTIGYLDGHALAAIQSPGEPGGTGAAIWRAFDATCSHSIIEIEVPSLVGRQMNRLAWVWALSALSLIQAHDELFKAAIDLAWLGAPTNVALHVAAAEFVGVDHFVTADAVTASWAEMRRLNVTNLHS